MRRGSLLTLLQLTIIANAIIIIVIVWLSGDSSLLLFFDARRRSEKSEMSGKSRDRADADDSPSAVTDGVRASVKIDRRVCDNVALDGEWVEWGKGG